MRRASTVIALAGIVASLGFAGCGDDEEEPPSTTATEETGASGASGESGAVLPADVITEGNEICADGNEEIDAAFSGFKGQPSQAELQQVVTDTVVPSIQGQIDDLRELDDSAELTSVLDQAEDILADVEDDPSILTQGEGFDPINAELTRLGLTECAT